jgi:hydrogenase maturation factor HypF (carbamoyltransferase family)
MWVVETGGILAGVVEDLLAGRERGEVSSRFHRTMAEVVAAGCERIRAAGGPGAVALSGGTFQNLLLMEQVLECLVGKGFAVYRHRRVPANDGGLALGKRCWRIILFKGDRRQRACVWGFRARSSRSSTRTSIWRRPRWAGFEGT